MQCPEVQLAVQGCMGGRELCKRVRDLRTDHCLFDTHEHPPGCRACEVHLIVQPAMNAWGFESCMYVCSMCVQYTSFLTRMQRSGWCFILCT
jgi:hypothetical protein